MGQPGEANAMPGWATPVFGVAARWQRFRGALTATIEQLTTESAVDDEAGVIVVRVNGVQLRASMVNLAEQYARHGDSANLLAAWANHVRESSPGLDRPGTWDEAEPALRVQLYRDDNRPALARKLAEGLWLAPVLDFPHSMVQVTAELVAAWERPVDAVFALAAANLVDGFEPRIERKHEPLLLTNGNDYHAAATYLTLRDQVGHAPHGALVGFPTRFTVAILPLAAMPPAPVLEQMIAGNRQLHATGDGALSPELYWWQAGVLGQLSIGREGVAAILWPPELDALLK
jgi:hypothetical protein